MSTELERKIISLLKGGHALSESARRALIKGLGTNGRDILRQIAEGSLAVEHPKLRGKAVIALGFDDKDLDKSLEALRKVLKTGDEKLQVLSLRAFGRLKPEAVVDEVKTLIKDSETPPAVALAAARVAALIGGNEIAAELRKLRNRLLPLALGPQSPSIVSLDRLIKQASGTAPSPAEDEPKIVI
ncbi:MAG: hypothetical protein AB1746_13590 [Candidatus Zixiibacteriota bacterium]